MIKEKALVLIIFLCWSLPFSFSQAPRERSAAEQLADRLLAVRDEAERLKLLTAERDRVSSALIPPILNKAAQFQQQADYAAALSAYRLAGAVADIVDDAFGKGASVNGLGGVYFYLGDYIDATEYFLKALGIAEQIGQKPRIASTHNNLGLVQTQQGNYDSALDHLQQSLAISESLNNRVEIARTLANIGRVYRERGNYAMAVDTLQKSLELAEASGNPEVTAYTLNILGAVLLLQGNYDAALLNYRKSLAIREAAGFKGGIAAAEESIGLAYFNQGNYRLAAEHLEKALAQVQALEEKASIAGAQDALGSAYRAQGDIPRAMDFYQKALAGAETVGEPLAISRTLNNLSAASRLAGQHDVSLDYAERASEIARRIGSHEALWQARDNSGRGYRALGQSDEARRAFEEAIVTIEALRTQVAGGETDQQRFFENKLAPYHGMVELLLARHENEQALTYAERAKARVLVDVLYSGRADLSKAMTGEERRLEKDFTGRLISLNTQFSRENLRTKPDAARLETLKTQLETVRTEYQAFQTRLYAARSELRAQRGEARPLTLEQAQSLLPDRNSALLEYLVTEDETYLFVVTSGSTGGSAAALQVYPLKIKRRELAERAAQFREALSKGDLAFRQPGRQLYDILLKPAARQLEGKTSLIISPDDSLWELPFQALQSAQTKYLLEDYVIAYTPSWTALREMKDLEQRHRQAAGRESAPTVLAFGNPSLGRLALTRAKSGGVAGGLEPLPEAERQVNALKEIYGPARSTVHVGDNAREEKAKAEAGEYRIVHLATHGILNNRSPMYSHVVMAQTEGSTLEDGLLEAWEILKLDLTADVAVLSACETARGRVSAGEGMIGLSWALFVAGVPTTVVSQWKVESGSTTDLMVEFHKRLRASLEGSNRSGSKAQALREAALKVLHGRSEYRHPFFWAGFVMVGAGL